MADENDGAILARQRPVQRFDGLRVEVVGWSRARTLAPDIIILPIPGTVYLSRSLRLALFLVK